MRPLLLALGLLAVFSTLSPAQGPPPALVRLGPVTSREVAENQAVEGVVYYERISRLSTEQPGLVREMAVREGDRVAAGGAIARLDTGLLDRDIAETGIRIDQAATRIEQAQKDFDRIAELYAGKGISEKAHDDARFTLINRRQEQRILEEQLARLHLLRQRCDIRAPFAGVVLEKHVDVGDWVAQGRQIVTLAALDRIFVRVPVAETLLERIPLGARLPVTITASGTESFGTVEAVAPLADPQTRNVFLKLKISPDAPLAENQSATVHVPVSAPRQATILPRAALVRFQGADFVYTVEEGKAAIHPVRVVAWLGAEAAVTADGIEPGMDVVVEGNERLRPDQPVQVAGEGGR